MQKASLSRAGTATMRGDRHSEKKGAPDRALFVDVQEMKQKIKENMYKPKYNVVDEYFENGWAQYVARHQRFEQAGLGVIALNALWIAIDTDYNDKEVLYKAHWVFIAAENFFCVFFLIEWLIRWSAFRNKFAGFRDGWFVFDGTLVVMMVMENWILNIILAATGFSFQSSMGDASILRLVRLLRLTRMARMARLLRAVPELMILIKGMAAATRSVFFTLCLLVAIIYVFAIAFVQLTKDTSFGDTYFKTVGLSMFTLLLRGTYLDEITEIMDDMREESLLLVFIFLAFVLLAAQTVTNMLIGVLCEVVSIVAATEKEEMMISFVVTKMADILAELDYNKDHYISKKEFVMMLSNSEATRTLQEVGVDAVGLVDFADVIFAGDDHDEDTVLSFEEFMDIVLQFRGSNTATVKDVIESQKIVRNGVRNVAHHLKKIEEQLVQSGVIEPLPLRFGQATFAMKSTGSSLGPMVAHSKSSSNLHRVESNASVFSTNDNRGSIDFGSAMSVPSPRASLRPQNAACQVGLNSMASNAYGVNSATASIGGYGKSLKEVAFEPRSEGRYSCSTDTSITVPRDLAPSNLVDTLSAQMLAIHTNVSQGHASILRIVSAHLEDEVQLRTAAEGEVTRLLEENRQLRDLLGTVDRDATDRQVVVQTTSTGHIIKSPTVLHAPNAPEASSTTAKKGLLMVKADPQSGAGQSATTLALPGAAGSAPPLRSTGEWRPSSATSLRPPSSGSTRRRDTVDNPFDDRLEFFTAQLPGSSSTTRAEAESNRPGLRAAAQLPAPNRAPPRPVDVAQPLPPQGASPAMHLDSSTRESRQQAAPRLQYWRDPDDDREHLY